MHQINFAEYLRQRFPIVSVRWSRESNNNGIIRLERQSEGSSATNRGKIHADRRIHVKFRSQRHGEIVHAALLIPEHLY